MNLYTPLAEYREAYFRLLAASVSIRMERQPPPEFAIGVLDAYGLLHKAARQAMFEYRKLEVALKLDRDELFDTLVEDFGRSIYYASEPPVVRAMIQICAEQYPGWSAEECAKAIATKYDNERLADAV